MRDVTKAGEVIYIRKWRSIVTIQNGNNNGFVDYEGVSDFDK